MMKSAKPSTLKVPRRDGKSSIRRSKSVRLRGVSLNLESRFRGSATLLSISTSNDGDKNLTSNVIGSSAFPVPVPTTTFLSPGLQESVADKGKIATVIAPTTPTAAATSHIYTGKPTTFLGPLKGLGAAASTTGSGQYNPNQAAALAAATGKFKAQPQFLVMPTNSPPANGARPADFEGPAGYSPAQIVGAYGIVGNGAGQTIALIDDGDYTGFVNSTDPNFDSSALHIFDEQFGLPDPPSFTKFNQLGQTSPLPPPSPQPGAGGEIALDVEWAHAIAPAANIILVEGSSSSFADLGTAAKTAATLLSASVVSQSFGNILDFYGVGRRPSSFSTQLITLQPSPPIPKSRSLAEATGDEWLANGPSYPAVSPLTVAVGGTTLFTNNGGQGDQRQSGGRSGPAAAAAPSDTFGLPSYQDGVSGFDFGQLTSRTSPDISADADPNTGVSVYDPVDYGGWTQVGGTSVSTPMHGRHDRDRRCRSCGPGRPAPGRAHSDPTRSLFDLRKRD